MYVTCQICSKPFYADQEWKKICLQCWIDKKYKERNNTEYRRHEPPKQNSLPVSFEDDLIKKLIYLCHPDKHNNSEVANEVTKHLLNLRNKNR
jgi:hypothetical protein